MLHQLHNRNGCNHLGHRCHSENSIVGYGPTGSNVRPAPFAAKDHFVILADEQSASGKLISGVAVRAARCGVPVLAVAGAVEGDITPLYDMGVTAVFSINRRAEDFSTARHKSEENLRVTMDNILRLLDIGG